MENPIAMTTPITITELRSLPATIDLKTAARVLGLGRTKAYELAKQGQFPCRVICIGDIYRVPTSGLLELLGMTPGDGATEPTATAQRA